MIKKFLISMLAISLLFEIALFRPRLHLVKGESMQPTIKDGQFILSVIPSRIERGDVIIVKAADAAIASKTFTLKGLSGTSPAANVFLLLQYYKDENIKITQELIKIGTRTYFSTPHMRFCIPDQYSHIFFTNRQK